MNRIKSSFGYSSSESTSSSDNEDDGPTLSSSSFTAGGVAASTITPPTSDEEGGYSSSSAASSGASSPKLPQCWGHRGVSWRLSLYSKLSFLVLSIGGGHRKCQHGQRYTRLISFTTSSHDMGVDMLILETFHFAFLISILAFIQLSSGICRVPRVSP